MGEGLPVPLQPCLPLSLSRSSADVWFSASRSTLSWELTEAQAGWKSPLLLSSEEFKVISDGLQFSCTSTMGVNEFILVTQTRWITGLRCLMALS